MQKKYKIFFLYIPFYMVIGYNNSENSQSKIACKKKYRNNGGKTNVSFSSRNA